MVKALPEKCRKCAMLSAEQAQVLHGAEGNGCWNPAVCYSRRFYARNRDRINQTRSRKRKEGDLEQIPVEFEPLSQVVFGVLSSIAKREPIPRFMRLGRRSGRFSPSFTKKGYQAD